MYQDILRAIAGIEIFPVISLFMFIAVFAAVLVYVTRLAGPRVERLARLPLDADRVCTNCGACRGTCAKEAER
jgi:cytochrome c oxidase cbb3-type subunit IV